MQPSNHHAYEFGDFRFEPDEARLSRAGDTVNLEPKAIAVLGEMVARPGHLHARDDLLDAVWGHRHVTPSTLNRVVTMLRQALGDEPSAPRFIETVPRKGYRFIAEVHATDDGDGNVDGQHARRHGDALFTPQPLPARVESEIPRDVELAALQSLLRKARLLTVLGPGGIGKTALALELARRSVEAYPDGVWLVDLTPCRNETDVGDMLLATFGLAKHAGEWEQRLAAALRPRNLLLLLDNCERVAQACAGVAEGLLRRCPGLRILATSQVRLGMEGEQDYRVPALSLPEDGWELSADPVASARESEAVRLLELRAREADPLFTMDRDNIAAVVGLCRHLDGLPLALELAASRLRVLGPDDLLERLQARREVLVANWQGGPERQRTARDMLDWSFHLLSAEEAQLLQRLSLFSGGWTLEGAEALMANDDLTAHDVVGPLGSLVDKSFVVVEHHAKPRRFRMLETVRQYALERLAADPRADVYRSRHLQHFLAVTSRADVVLYDEPMHWYGAWLDREQANLRLAFEFALSHGLAHDALALALNLRWHWWQQGQLQRAQAWIEQALAADAAASPVARAQALQFIGLMALHLSEDTAEATLVDAVASTAQVGLRREHGLALAALAMVQIMAGRHHEARLMLSRAMREAIAIDDAQMLGYSLIWVTAMHSSANRNRLGWLAAQRACSGLEAFWRARGTPPGFLYGFAQVNLGLQAYFLGDLQGAAHAFDAALTLAANLRNLRMSAAALEGFGYVLQQQGQAALAARILGNAQGLRELTAVPMSGHWQAAHGKVWRRLQHELGGEAEVLFEAGMRQRQDDLHAELRDAYPALGLQAAAAKH